MKRYLLIAASSLILLVCLVPLAIYGGHHWKFSIANFVYCGFTYYLLRNTTDTQNRFKIAGMIALPVLLLVLPIHIIHFHETMYSVPGSIAHLTGICAGIFLTYLSNEKKAVFLSLFIAASLWVTVSGYVFWANKAFYGTYTGQVNETISPFTLVGANGQPVSSASLKGQFVVLDFWNTGCVSCFKKFPQLQQYHNRYKHNAKVKFFAVNVPLSRDYPGQAAKAIKKDGYTFPVLLAESKTLTSLFKVNSFPTVIVLDPSQRVIYRGLIDNIDQPLSGLMD